MQPAARLNDQCSAGHNPPTTLPGTGSPTVSIGNSPAWRAALDTHLCATPIAPPAPAPHGPEKCYFAALSVLIENQMAVRKGDVLFGAGPPNRIASGDESVVIGNPGFGLSAGGRMCDFCVEFRQLVADWDTLSEDERVAALEGMVNRQLQRSGVPHTPVEASGVSGSMSGHMNPNTWKIHISRDAVQAAPTNEVARLLYHEARHAEQWFAAARLQGGSGMGLPAHVRQAAYAAPLTSKSSPMAMLGEMTHRSVYDPVDGARRNDILSRSETDPLADQQYRALPEEQDAYGLDAELHCI
jgi:hypothetical protein